MKSMHFKMCKVLKIKNDNGWKVMGGRTLPIDPLIDAATVIMIIPVILVFFITQKYLVQGIVTTGLKG